MADLESAGSILAHGGSAIGSGGLGAWLMHFFKSKQEAVDREKRQELDQRIAVTLAELARDMKEIRGDLAKQEQYGERLSRLEEVVKGLQRTTERRRPSK